MSLRSILRAGVGICLVLLTGGESFARASVYEVREGDSLWLLARRFGMTIGEIRQLNGLRGSRIYPGQRLRIGSDIQPISDEPFTPSPVYEVRKGDSLWLLALRFRTTIGEIKRINGLRGSQIHPGQRLRMGPGIQEVAAHNGPYYWRKPRVLSQKSRGYTERSRSGLSEDYRRGHALLQAFDADLQAKLAKNRKRRLPLKGWKIAIDPGHGGLDPGAIVSNKDGNDHSLYVVEDEYVYDIALRMYRQLRLYGAEVEMTVISPNHLIRKNTPAKATFVHEQNEVYNSEQTNRKNVSSARPNGHNLSKRVEIANRFFGRTRRTRTLFVSLHADNSPERPKGPLVMYLSRRGKIDRRSRKFAQAMQASLDQPDIPAQIKGRNLAVLRENRAYAEILVEIRNVHDIGEAWLLRYHERRQEDAERIVKGILNYVSRL